MAPIGLLETIHSLAKRDGDTIGGIPTWLLVFLVMLGAGTVVIVIYGLARFMLPEKEGLRPLGAEQANYMREVRVRNLNGLLADYAPRGPHRQRQSNTR
ncbi:hypothetical protein PMIN06_006712 [Paraphaeosphaeria minitans]|uniref:Uncharacterized protein n=1 Tax=Paraphaeosphaeria minitans TaxID=565426 RepID=A0A9P6GHZ4_9PLEO|nr:hypothetical protein PMIN01_07412 [Paraphaeosphaeria minitans]